MSKENVISGWYVITMNDKRICPCLVSERAICDTVFLQIDIPSVENSTPYTQIINPRSVESLTPSTEENCKRMIKTRKPKPFVVWAGEYRKESYHDTFS